ncbi:DUF2946 family protein [Pseudomonas sp. zfem005]|uniref:DUF2946 family protein n=2 Tax=unclassified Pseudomonas TaxID=196821 RepID=UPI0029297545|nr:DUF2946 family protein [Pseudomonas sp. zfem005]MDU9414375.1 DUF2946 family protein [Pseudomonas sp. zfem005]
MQRPARPHLKSARRRPGSLIAWMLYACVLYSVFSCGIHHGQAAGLQLSGLETPFCSADGQPSAGSGTSLPLPAAWLASFTCPLCASVPLGIGLLLGLSWLLRGGHAPHPRPRPRPSAPPRHAWPPASPRAPPAPC